MLTTSALRGTLALRGFPPKLVTWFVACCNSSAESFVPTKMVDELHTSKYGRPITT